LVHKGITGKEQSAKMRRNFV